MVDDVRLPEGARPFVVSVDANLDAVVACGSWSAWRERMVQEMEREGMVVMRVEHTRFYGYVYPDRMTSPVWLCDASDEPSE
jgi:hypothetical protein